MSLAVSGTEDKKTCLLSQCYSMLLDIRNVRFANESNMDYLFHAPKSSMQKKRIMICHMLKFNIPDTYAGLRFIDLNICCGF